MPPLSLADFRRARFVTSASRLAECPADEGAEVAFAGRSNAGKSSCINVLTDNRHLARTSKTPGRTQLINFFAIDYDARQRLVDLPGYGYAKAPKDVMKQWRFLVNDYLRGRAALKRTLLLIDARHGIKDVDRDIMKMLDDAAVSYRIVLTKTDKIKASELAEVTARTIAEARTRPAAHPEIIATSSEKGMGLAELRSAVIEALD